MTVANLDHVCLVEALPVGGEPLDPRVQLPLTVFST